MHTTDSLDRYTPEVQDILGSPPRSIVRYGLSFIGVVALLLTGLAWWVRYPDTLSVPCVLTAKTPAVPLLVPANGLINRLMVSDSQSVKPHQPIALLENPASYESVLVIRKVLKLGRGESLPATNHLVLGELLAPYVAYQKAHSQLAFFRQLRYHERKLDALTQKLQAALLLRQNLAKQAGLAESDFRLGQRQFNLDSTLYTRRGITPYEFVNSERTYVREQSSFWQSRTTLINADVQLAELKQSIVELQLEQRQKERELTSAVEDAYRTLLERLDDWERKYVINSPIDGIITFNLMASPHVPVKAGEVLANVVPHRPSQMYCKARLPISGSGKIAVGQRVQIRLDNFPATEYGSISGHIQSIAITPGENGYFVQIRLPQGLKTSYGTMLPYKPDITGTAQIITADRRLLERLLTNLTSLLQRSEGK